MALYDYERQQYQQPRKPVSIDELFRQMQAQAFGNQNTSQPVEESSGLRRFVGDPLVSLGRGVIGAGEGFVGLANIPTAGYAGKALTDLTGYDPAEAKRSLATLYTPEQQQAFQEVEAAKGFLPTLKSRVQRPSTIAHNVIESVPSMVGGSLIGRKALQYAPGIATALGSRAGMLAGAAGEGTMTAGQIAETSRQQSDDGLINFKQAGQAIAGGIGTGALGVVGNDLGGKLANKLGVDITDIDTALVTGKLASSGNIGKRLIAGGISEGVFEELPQSVQEQMWTNAATGRDLYEGVQEAAATGLLTGAAMGAGANVFSDQNVDDTKNEEAKPPREQLLNVDKQIFDLEQNTQTPESQQTLNTLYGQRDELLKNIRGITNTPVTKYEQPLSDDIDTISRQITNLEASGRDTIGTRELLQDLYGQKEILAKQIEDAPWIETEREIERQQRVRDYQNKIKVIESDETLSEEDKTNQINLLTQQYQQDYKPRDFASEARKTMQKSVEKLTTGTFIPADQNELDMAMDDLMAQYEELAKEEEDIKKSEEIINNQKRVLGLSKQVDVLKEIQPLKDRAKVENIFNSLMIKENQTGLTEQEKKTLTTAKAKLTKDNNRIEKIAKLNQEMSQLFTDTDETLMGRFQRDFDIQRQESQEQQEYKNTLYDKNINFVTAQDKISPRGLMGQFDLTYPEAQELLKNMEAEGIVGQSGKANIRNVNKVSEVRSNIEHPLVNQITEQEQPILEEQPIQPVQPDMQEQIVQDVPEMSNEKSPFTDEQPVEQIVNQQQEQPVEQTINTEQPPITKPVESIEDFQTIEDPLIAIQEDIQARQDNISALKEELEANKLEQSRMDINDPMLEELRLDEQAINEQIKEANRELAIVRIVDGKRKFQITYHGTPHQWQPELGFPNGRPRLDKIGTGEGAAAFGHGWYSAEVSETAESYKTSNESNLISRIANISDVYGNPTKGNEKSHAELTKQLENLPDSGALYKLDIPDETIPKLLEWDKPISEQSTYVKSALKKLVSDKDFISSLRQDRGSRPDFITGVMGISDEQFQNKYIAKGYSFKNGDMYNRKGEKLPKTAVEQQRMLDEGSQVYRDMGHMYRDLAHMLGSDVAASNALLNVGIPGNKYFDGMSRADGKGSYNYVIWDQNVLDKIALLERNGEKIKAIQKQYETRNKQEPTKGISLLDIKKNFKTEEVSQDENGIISVKFKNGKGITFNSVQDAGNGFIQFAINTGQLSKNGKILGVTTGSNVLLDKDFADNKTVWHETFHVFKNLNMINDAEYSHLVKDFNKLRKAGKLQFSLSTHEDPMAALEENLANSFAQVMTSREDYRNTALGKMIQRIMDFMKKMFSFGQQSLSGFAKEVETGKIYDREISDLENQIKSDDGNDFPHMKVITDRDFINKLESGQKVKFYRAMQLIDGKLYPPMSAKVEGKLRQPTEFGQWEIADERPELADDKGQFKLDKANKSAIKARYNPYFHMSASPLNDQFSSAYARPNLVTVEVEVPISELTSNYKAEKAKDSVGIKNWHAGPVSSKLPDGKKRTVMLSRYAKAVRIVPDNEIALTIADLLKDENISIPDNVVTPSLLQELQKLGVNIIKSKQVEKVTNAPNFQSIGNTNSEEFKTWFGKSAAKTKAGEPVVFYHGTPNNFTVFENRPGQSTLHATSGLGHFFTMDKNYAEAYSKETGNVMPVYLKMEKPYKMSLEEAQSYETVLDTKVAQRLLKRKGYDSVIIPVPGSQPMITIFNSNQIKSINNQGTWDINNPDIRFEVREKLGIPEQDIPQAEYDKMRQENRDLIGKTKQFLRSKGHEVNREMNKYLGVTSTNLAKIHPMLRAKVRRLDFDTLQRIHSNLNIALPVLEAVKKMSSNERSDFDWAVKNGDSGKILSLTGKYNFTEQYNALRAMLDQTHEDLKDVGYKPGFVDTYWPRLMKDREGFLQATREISRDPVFTQALQDKASKLGKTIEQLDTDVRADIIAQKIMEIKSGMGGPANIQGRIFDKIPIDLGKYYMDSSAALVQYIYSTAKNIEARKFFGKVPTKISNAKNIVRQNNDKLNKLQNTAGLLASQDRDTTDIDLQIKEVKDNIKLHEKVIEEYGQTRDFTDNIGSYIDEIRASQLIPEKKFQENEGILKDILSARFHERGTSGIANIYKNVSLLDTMGSPLSAFTQIQDLGWSIYVGGLTPRGITNTVKNIGKAIAKRSDITKEDLGLEWIAQEFADADTLSSVVNKTFKLIGLNYVDSIGKESLINNAYDNYRVKAKDKPKLFKEIRHMFNSDKETNQVIEDLQNNVRDSKDVQFLTFSRLLDFQPAAKSEMPEKMLTAGNWRLAYLLKTFTIKQFDVFRNEVWHKLKSGDKGQVIEGLRNMAYLTSIMTLSGAGADELKDFILGKETRFEDHVIENFLTLGGANRYIRMQVNREGIGTALGKQVLPPFKFIDNLYKDISQDVTDLHSARFVDSIPVVGKLYYWHLGRGAENKESIAKQDFKKLGKDVREFKKRLENNTDKRAFVQANISEYRQMKRHENVKGNLNKYTSLINKLKKVPQTENVKRRINQLEDRKEQIMTRYFM